MKKIEKLEPRFANEDAGCGGASFSEVIDKVNEVIDFLNREEYTVSEKTRSLPVPPDKWETPLG